MGFSRKRRASDRIKELSIIEDEQITIYAGGGIPIDKIHAVIWFRGKEVYGERQIVNSVSQLQNGKFSIGKVYGDLIIQYVDITDEGYYTVQVNDEETARTTTYHLDVYYMDSPNFIASIDNSNSHYAFYCIWGNIYPEMEPKVTWTLNGNLLNTSTPKYSVTDEGKRWNKLVIFENMSENDFGNYSCRITVNLDEGTMEKTSNLEEIWQASSSAAPSIETFSVIEGDRTVIPARVDVPINTIQSITWYKFKSPQTNYTIVSLTNRTNGRFSIDGTGKNYGDLIIQHADREDARYYTCQILQNRNSREKTITYYLDLYYLVSPTLTTFTENSPTGNKYGFYCIWFKMNPEMEPYVAWLHNGHILKTSTTKYSVIKDEERSIQTLIILEMTENDVGEYACRITIETKLGMPNMSKTSTIEYVTISALDSPSSTGLSSTLIGGLATVTVVCILVSILTCVIARVMYVSISNYTGNKNTEMN
ncbi:uncharacterized protein [Antedon mediterranea]|uniref:uncharacterized protein n=1 Tax=Antedon mediterranea TaxID=105859 RepID=UPI003AF5788A